LKIKNFLRKIKIGMNMGMEWEEEWIEDGMRMDRE